jgi:hypothetical protein
MPSLDEVRVAGLWVIWLGWLSRDFLGAHRLGTTNGLFLSRIQIKNGFFE